MVEKACTRYAELALHLSGFQRTTSLVLPQFEGPSVQQEKQRTKQLFDQFSTAARDVYVQFEQSQQYREFSQRRRRVKIDVIEAFFQRPEVLKQLLQTRKEN